MTPDDGIASRLPIEIWHAILRDAGLREVERFAASSRGSRAIAHLSAAVDWRRHCQALFATPDVPRVPRYLPTWRDTFRALFGMYDYALFSGRSGVAGGGGRGEEDLERNRSVTCRLLPVHRTRGVALTDEGFVALPKNLAMNADAAKARGRPRDRFLAVVRYAYAPAVETTFSGFVLPRTDEALGRASLVLDRVPWAPSSFGGLDDEETLVSSGTVLLIAYDATRDLDPLSRELIPDYRVALARSGDVDPDEEREAHYALYLTGERASRPAWTQPYDSDRARLVCQAWEPVRFARGAWYGVGRVVAEPRGVGADVAAGRPLVWAMEIRRPDREGAVHLEPDPKSVDRDSLVLRITVVLDGPSTRVVALSLADMRRTAATGVAAGGADADADADAEDGHRSAVDSYVDVWLDDALIPILYLEDDHVRQARRAGSYPKGAIRDVENQALTWLCGLYAGCVVLFSPVAPASGPTEAGAKEVEEEEMKNDSDPRRGEEGPRSRPKYRAVDRSRGPKDETRPTPVCVPRFRAGMFMELEQGSTLIGESISIPARHPAEGVGPMAARQPARGMRLRCERAGCERPALSVSRRGMSIAFTCSQACSDTYWSGQGVA